MKNKVIEDFKAKIDSAIATGSKDIRLSRDEYIKITVALGNVLLENAELKEQNRMLVDRAIEQKAKPINIDGGKF